ncbi:MAG: hypothetical protein Q4E47_01315 [Candidatus Saccharibacteria bacterium]|nr:hypothetical protein [Candidatus Saccharibacteria bacterium]
MISTDNLAFLTTFSEYSLRHFKRNFEKDYPKKVWRETEKSILYEISEISKNNLGFTQKVDELWQKDNFWIFKYDFRIVGMKKSTRSAGNRCIVFLDNLKKQAEILLIYRKTDLPKNKSEQAYIEAVVRNEFPSYYSATR